MSLQNRMKLARAVCKIFPPAIAQKVRNYIFPLNDGIKLNQDFTCRSVTGSTYSGNTLDYHSYRFAIHGYFEWRNVVIANFLSKTTKGDIVEIGANVGTETVAFCDILKEKGTVHAFEPLPSNIADLEKIKAKQPNLRLYHNAVSNVEAVLRFLKPPETSSGTGKVILEDNGSEETINVDAAPLDSFPDQFNNIILMAIDTEGHEPFVLEGARATFQKHRPAVIIEVSPKLLIKYASASIDDIYSFFKSIDYTCYNIEKFGLKEIGDQELTAKSSNNWFCIPSDTSKIIKPLSAELFKRAICPWYLLPKIPT